MEATTKHTCLKLEVDGSEQSVFVKGTWLPDYFEIAVTDGLDAWLCSPTGEEVRERAAQWDQPVAEYVALAERYLGFQQPNSVYRFVDAGDGCKRISWTFEKEGTKLEWRWKCQPSPDCRKTTAEILDFLLDANIRLSEEVVSKTQSFEKLKVEAEKCLTQSERFTNEKLEFESAIYAKFLAVLNSKKAKLRKLRDQNSKKEAAGKSMLEEEESSDQNGSDEERSAEENAENFTSRPKQVFLRSGRGRRHGRAKITTN